MPTTMLVFCLGPVPRYIDLQLIFTKQFQDLDSWVWISIFYICMNPGTQSQQETRGTFNGWCLCSWACCLGMMVQGLRVAMPLTRIALQSPAGAARGQVLFLSICPFLHLRWDIWCLSKAMAKRVLNSVQSIETLADPIPEGSVSLEHRLMLTGNHITFVLSCYSLAIHDEVMVWHFVTNSHKLMTALSGVLPAKCCSGSFSAISYVCALLLWPSITF